MHSLLTGVFIFFVDKCHQDKPVVALPFAAVWSFPWREAEGAGEVQSGKKDLEESSSSLLVPKKLTRRWSQAPLKLHGRRVRVSGHTLKWGIFFFFFYHNDSQALEQIAPRDPRISVLDGLKDPDKALSNLVWIQCC